MFESIGGFRRAVGIKGKPLNWDGANELLCGGAAVGSGRSSKHVLAGCIERGDAGDGWGVPVVSMLGQRVGNALRSGDERVGNQRNREVLGMLWVVVKWKGSGRCLRGDGEVLELDLLGVSAQGEDIAGKDCKSGWY